MNDRRRRLTSMKMRRVWKNGYTRSLGFDDCRAHCIPSSFLSFAWSICFPVSPPTCRVNTVKK